MNPFILITILFVSLSTQAFSQETRIIERTLNPEIQKTFDMVKNPTHRVNHFDMVAAWPVSRYARFMQNSQYLVYSDLILLDENRALGNVTHKDGKEYLRHNTGWAVTYVTRIDDKDGYLDHHEDVALAYRRAALLGTVSAIAAGSLLLKGIKKLHPTVSTPWKVGWIGAGAALGMLPFYAWARSVRKAEEAKIVDGYIYSTSYRSYEELISLDKKPF